MNSSKQMHFPGYFRGKTSGRPYLDAWRDVINDPDGFAVRVAR